MSIRDKVMISILTLIDRVLDFVSFGAWSLWQGERVPQVKVSGKK